MNQKCLAWYELPAKRWRNNPDSFYERDSQKQKLYDAENIAKGRMIVEGIAIKEFSSLEEVQEFINKLTASAWFRRRWGHHTVAVRNTPGTWARGNTNGYIKLPFRNTWCRNIIVVLHELSHVVERRGTPSDHGRFFARTLLELVEHAVGYEAAKVLKKSFRKGRVKYLPKRELSEETREKMRRNFINNVLKQKVEA